MAIGKIDFGDATDTILHDDAALSQDPRGPADGGQLEDPDAPPDTQEYLNQRLGKMERAIQSSSLMLVPGVAEALRAQQSGQKIHFLTDAQVAQLQAQGAQNKATAEPEVEPDWDNLQLKDAIPGIEKKLMGKLIPALKTTLQEMLTPIMGKLEAHDSHFQSQKTETIAQQVQVMSKKYPDFMRYKDKMVELNEKTPGLELEDLYLIAKRRSGHAPVQTQNTTQSERPTSNSARPPARQPAEKPVVGRQNFGNALSAALKTMDVSGFPDDR